MEKRITKAYSTTKKINTPVDVPLEDELVRGEL
jgi:hypothetical protein